MSGSITTLPVYEWTRAPQDLIPALNKTAVPIARVDEVTVSNREMVAADVQAIATTVPPPPRTTFTAGADVPVPAWMTVIVGTAGFFGAVVGDNMLVSNPLITASLHGEVLSTGNVTITARNLSPVDTTVLTGLVLEIVKV